MTSSCPHDPREMAGKPIGMYHCPECDEMVLAGYPHPAISFMDDESDRVDPMMQKQGEQEREGNTDG